jgi:hypothetical protein
MFGFVTANSAELTKEQKRRYSSVYCGICRRIRGQHTNLARMTLSYDMAFLALLLMSLYEPEETGGNRACALHPIHPRPWVDNAYVRYAADMNVALAYYQCLDDWRDEKKHSAHFMADHLQKRLPELKERYPRQCGAIADCITQLTQLEKENCRNPDLPANCFGQLMGELLVYEEDLWAPYLRQLGQGLGRFIYLADAVADFPKDSRKGSYNPLDEACREDWDDYLVLAMGHCTAQYEKLPLVQDKALLDNILYSGVWTNMKRKKKEEGEG